MVRSEVAEREERRAGLGGGAAGGVRPLASRARGRRPSAAFRLGLLAPVLAALGACDVLIAPDSSLGRACRAASDCPSGQTCAEEADGTLACQESCVPAAGGCPNGFHCVPLMSGGFCEQTPNVTPEDAASPPDASEDARAADAPSPIDGARSDATVDASGADAGLTDAPDQDAPDGTLADADAGAADAGGDVTTDSPASPGDAEGGTDGAFQCGASRAASTLVLFGGQGSTDVLGDTWLWDGSSWSLALAGDPGDAGDAGDSMPAGPAARAEAAMGVGCGYAVLTGGYDSNFETLQDAWLWDGSAWASSAYAPPARSAAAAGSLGNGVVLFGGQDPSGVASTPPLVLWDGGAWETVVSAGPSAPDPRIFSNLVSVSNGLLLVGGQTTSAVPILDTWLFTGTAWQLLDPTDASPQTPALLFPGVASLGNTVVLFGGADHQGHIFGDTWIWDGATWTRTPAQAGGPPARYSPAMAGLNGRIVLFGGLDETGNLLGDTWVWTAGTWSAGPASGPSKRSNAAITAY